MAKWIVKRWASKWVRRCPYCNHMQAFDTEPSSSWVCQCKAIVDQELYIKLSRLGKALSQVLK